MHVRPARRCARQRAGLAARGDQTHVVREHLAVGKANLPLREIQGYRIGVASQIDVAKCPGVLREDVEARLLGRHQHGFGQRGALIRPVTLPPKHRDASAVAVFAQRMGGDRRSLARTNDDDAGRSHFAAGDIT